MAQDYFWSKTTASFYPVYLEAAYVAAGSFPSDAVLVDDSVWLEYGATPPAEGMIRGADASGNPCWVAAPVISV